MNTSIDLFFFSRTAGGVSKVEKVRGRMRVAGRKLVVVVGIGYSSLGLLLL